MTEQTSRQVLENMEKLAGVLDAGDFNTMLSLLILQLDAKIRELQLDAIRRNVYGGSGADVALERVRKRLDQCGRHRDYLRALQAFASDFGVDWQGIMVRMLDDARGQLASCPDVTG